MFLTFSGRWARIDPHLTLRGTWREMDGSGNGEDGEGFLFALDGASDVCNLAY